MKKIFIVGASILQLPAILKAKEMGLYVGVADYDSHAVGIPHADVYYSVSTIDEEGIFQAAKSFRADGIITLATDMPIRAVSYTANKMNLIGLDYNTAVNATDKGKMIEKLHDYNVPHPWFFKIVDIENLKNISEKLSYPCICKPTDSSGSRGVILINNFLELEQSILYSKQYSKSGEVIIEEFMIGEEVSVEVLVYNKEYFILNITDKLTTGAPYFVELGHSQPSNLSTKILEEIKKISINALKALNINNGAAHVEIIVTEKGPKIVEVGARMGGDCITTDLVPLSTGIDMVKAVIQIALGEKIDIVAKKSNGAAIRYLDSCQGQIISIAGIEIAKKIKGVEKIDLVKNVGDIYTGIKNSGDRIGYVIATAKTAAEAVSICETAKKYIKIEVK